jgi:hypothetical protein
VKIGSLTITLADLALTTSATIAVLAYINGWG